MGSTLRQDWLVALGLGACALKSGRPVLGGFLLAYAGLIRAFPAVAAMFLAVPLLWAVVGRLIEIRRARRGGDAPGAAAGGPLALGREVLARQRPTLRAIGGAAAAVALLMALSAGLFGWKAAWATWLDKIAIHAHSPSTNNVGLRNVMAFRPDLAARHVVRDDHPEPWDDWQRYQVRTLAERRYAFYAAIVLGLALTLLACRGRPLHQAALLGLLTVPFLFYPSNYYCHFVFLLPLAVTSRDREDTRDRIFAWVGVVLMAMCVGQYFTLAEGWSDLRYTYQSFVLLGGFALILAPLAAAGLRSLRDGLRPPAPAPEAP
jgi:hypothetical protein